MPETTNNLLTVTYYTPVELVGIYRNFLERGKSNGVVWLRGIYIQRPSQNNQWSAYYDELRDVDTNTSITLKINRQDRQRLKPNSLVQIGGLIELNPFTNGTIQIVVSVTRFEIIKDQFVTEQDIKRSEIRIAKTKRGFKNVDAVLEDKLFRDERPKVALIFASTSITMADFNAGVNAAAVKIDFTELRQSFGNGASLAVFLKQQDEMQFDTIALIRGGGNGIEALDDIAVLQTVSEMKTPIICAIGHVGEELFLKSIADKVAPTPNGLGQYFSEMVERVAAKRNNSRAALVQEVKKQFQKQLEDSNKKNKELLAQIEKMTKQQQEQTKANKENIDKLNEQNKKNLEAQQKKNDEALAKFQAQSKQQMEQSQKQNAALQKQLADLSKSQKESLDKLTEQNKQTNTLLERERQHSRELERQLASKPNYTTTFIIIAIIATVVGFILAQIMK
jgi:flagellar biosynthesis GTPase FlhF